jgi:hypothetical protein
LPAALAGADFRTLPLAAAADVLQAWGRAAVQRTLDGTDAGGDRRQWLAALRPLLHGLELSPGRTSAARAALFGGLRFTRPWIAATPVQALIGDAISHVVLPGIVAAFLVTGAVSTGPMMAGAAVAAVVAVVLIEVVRRVGRIEPGAAMGVVGPRRPLKITILVSHP